MLFFLLWFTVEKPGRCGRDRMVVGFTVTYMQLVPITTDVASSESRSW